MYASFLERFLLSPNASVNAQRVDSLLSCEAYLFLERLPQQARNAVCKIHSSKSGCVIIAMSTAFFCPIWHILFPLLPKSSDLHVLQQYLANPDCIQSSNVFITECHAIS